MKGVLAPLLLVLIVGLWGSATACGRDADADPKDASCQTSTSGGGSSSSSSTGGASSSGSAGSSSGSSSSGASSASSSSGTSGTFVDGGGLGIECVFTGNYGCDPQLRCECEGGDEADCTCQLGARGAGPYNEPCESSNDCVSGICLSGPTEGGAKQFFCSKFCAGPADCDGAPLSQCDTKFTNLCNSP